MIAALSLAVAGAATLQSWLESAFYPTLLGILCIASLGLPIPEDIPLICAGVVLKTHPGVATWAGTMLTALIGIMIGDLVLYTAGRRWGRDVFRHRSVNWIITPDRFERAISSFHRYGMWYCFFGRFFMGVRAVMCITAGVTHFPYWRFFLADFSGALLSVPLFIALGYFGAHALPTVRKYVVGAQGILLVGAIIVVALVVILRLRRRRKRRAAAAAELAHVAAASPAGGAPGVPGRHATANVEL